MNVLLLQRTLQKQSMTYGGKSTVRDRSSGISSSVAFTPLQVHKLLFENWLFLQFFSLPLGCRSYHLSLHNQIVFTHSSAVAFCLVPLLKHWQTAVVDLLVNCLLSVRGWRLWTHRLQRRRWLKPIRNISPTWPSSSRSSTRRTIKCEAVCQTKETIYTDSHGRIHTSTVNLYSHTPTQTDLCENGNIMRTAQGHMAGDSLSGDGEQHILVFLFFIFLNVY